MFKQKHPAPDARINKQREYEHKLVRLQSKLKEEHHLGAVANWEERSAAKLRTLELSQQLEQCRQQRQAELDVRRQRLAAKLWHEENVLKQELLNSVETPEERRSKLAARARALAEAREAERKQLALQLLDQAFSENFEPLRAKLSQKALDAAIEERNHQLEEKQLARTFVEKEKAEVAQCLAAQQKAAEDRYQREQKAMERMKIETKHLLGEQVKAYYAQASREQEAHLQETQELKQQWQREEQEAQERRLAETRRQQQFAEEVKAFNLAKMREDQRLADAERDLDLKYLNDALRQEAAAAAADVERKLHRQKQQTEYNEHLRQQAVRDQEDTAARDALIAQAAAMQQSKQDAEWAAREAARKKLMVEVAATREKQISHKQMLRMQDLIDQQRERQWLEEELQVLDQMEVQARENEKAKLQLQHGSIKVQMEHKYMQARQQREEEKSMLEREQQELAEKEAKAKAVLDAPVSLRKFHGRKKVDWFY